VHVGDVEVFADLVKRIRQARGQTQEELARDLDVTVGTMNGWENGRHRPVKAQRRRLIAMAEALGLQLPRNENTSSAA
jgi:transcriptional regulator with XRE-family HTH domain